VQGGPYPSTSAMWRDVGLRGTRGFRIHSCTLTRVRISLYLGGMRLPLWILALLLGLGAAGCDRLGPVESDSDKGKLKIEQPGESPDTDRKGDVKGHPSAVGGGIIYDDGL